MLWDLETTNKVVLDAFSAYKQFVHALATHQSGVNLLEEVDLSPLGKNFPLKLSTDFDEGATTTKSIKELQTLVQNGAFSQLSLRLATVQLCTAYEVLFDSVADAYSVSIPKNEPAIEVVDPRVSKLPIKLGNKTIKQIFFICELHKIVSPMNTDDTLAKIAAIIEIRNCIVHGGGKVGSEKSATLLRAYAINCKVGEMIVLKKNHFDNFLHFMAINARAMLKNVP
jgi:hypothetical protein